MLLALTGMGQKCICGLMDRASVFEAMLAQRCAVYHAERGLSLPFCWQAKVSSDLTHGPHFCCVPRFGVEVDNPHIRSPCPAPAPDPDPFLKPIPDPSPSPSSTPGEAAHLSAKNVDFPVRPDDGGVEGTLVHQVGQLDDRGRVRVARDGDEKGVAGCVAVLQP